MVAVALVIALGKLLTGCYVVGSLAAGDEDPCNYGSDQPGCDSFDPCADGGCEPYPIPMVPCPNGGDGECRGGNAWRCQGAYLADSPLGCSQEATCRLVPEGGHLQPVCSISDEPCQSVTGDGAECQGNAQVVCFNGYPYSKRACLPGDRCIVIDETTTDGTRCTLDAECPAEGATACHEGLVFVCDDAVSRGVRNCATLSHHCVRINGQGLCAVSPEGPRLVAFRPIAGGELELTGTSTLTQVDDFEMMETEVTLGQYAACQEAGACTPQHEPCRYDEHGLSSSVHADLPVRCVSFQQAAAYCDFVEARLPTEVEWEYALRNGGRDVRFPWGDAAPSCAHAIVSENAGFDVGCGRGEPWPGCSREDDVTEQGVCDLAGNVAEWVTQANVGASGARGGAYAGPPSDVFTTRPVTIPEGMRHVGVRCVR
jgi:hypothetical protein